MAKKKFYTSLLFQVTAGIVIGVTLGFLAPQFAKELKILGIGFIKLIKMMIAPIIFGTVVVGLAKMNDMKKVGRVGAKALIYFELVTTVALALGWVAAHLVTPGAGVSVDLAALDPKDVARFTTNTAKTTSTVDFLINIIPYTVVDAFAKGEILQVLLIALLSGTALTALGEHGAPLVRLIDVGTKCMLKCIGYIMRLAPLGAMGAIAFAVSSFGADTLLALGKLILTVYGTSIVFIVLVLGSICKYNGFSIIKLLYYLKEEILILTGTASSESVLPRLMTKLENIGCAKSLVGLTIPTGYSFNLDGSSLYLTIAALFIAQITGIQLTFMQELTIFAILLVTSKGVATVAGGALIVLAATLSTIDYLPVETIALLLAVDWFLSICRAITNITGNAVATIVVGRWEKAMDETHMHAMLNREKTFDVDTGTVLIYDEATAKNS